MYQIEPLDRGLQNWGQLYCACVVDADIETAKALDCLRHRLLDHGFVANVAKNWQSPASSCLNRLCRRVDRAGKCRMFAPGLRSDRDVAAVTPCTNCDRKAGAPRSAAGESPASAAT